MIIRRVGVGSLAKMLGAMYAGIGLIFGFFVSLAALFGAALGGQMPGQGNQIPPILGVLFGLGAVILLPVVYGVMGLIVGALSALIYNLVAAVAGGIEIEVTTMGPAAPVGTNPATAPPPGAAAPTP
jgi:hypothetical protein